ncbi:MAG: APH(3') family aminoglycoside O-phosphotransferase [Chitinophagaceae bacterium]
MNFDFLHHYFNDLQIAPLASGGTEATLYVINADGKRYVLKSQPATIPEESLAREQKIYAWLSGMVPVPEVKFMILEDGFEHLCMSYIPGKRLDDCQHYWTDAQLIRHYALALKQLHSLPMDASIPYWSLEDRLQLAKWRLQQGAIDRDDIDPKYRHLSLEELYDHMMRHFPNTSDQVFIHGDFCFDNLLFNGETLSGFIDMGRGGRGDRYQDLAIAARSVREAFGEERLGLFFTSYGLNNPSEEKLRFYTMLDEFY